MVKAVQDLWILSQAGKVLYQRISNVKMHTQLFGALISALKSFSQELTRTGLADFEASSFKFTLLKNYPLIFVATSNNKVKRKKIQDELKKISKNFFVKYADVLANWDSWDRNIDIFSDFEK